jgi:hypothetical protein
VHNGVNHPPNELVRMRILHETAEYLDADADWHLKQASRPETCERHPHGGPGCWHDATNDELRRLGKAVMLAPTLAICEALLRGERVPIDKLDPHYVALYGVRQ